MSTEKTHFQNFEEIADRVKGELGFRKDKQLIDILEIPQPTYNSRKMRNNFAAEWVVLLSMKYKFQVRWILTGEGPKTLERNEEENELPQGEEKYLKEIACWLKEITNRDPRKKGWFEVQFEKAFPEFLYWRKRKEPGEGENSLLQNVA